MAAVPLFLDCEPDQGLTNERQILATIAETTDAFIQVADLDYRWLAINRASADEFERIYGVRPAVGRSMLELLAGKPEHQTAVRAVWSRALAGEEFTEIGEFGEVERRFYEMRYNTLRGPAGERIGAFQIVTDVTERMRAQRELEAVETALRQSQKMEAIGQLTGGIAHDFNNLLQIVTGNLEMMLRRLPADDVKMRGLADNAMRGAARASALTQRLLSFARPTPGKIRSIEVNGLVAGMSDLVRQAVGGGIEIGFELIGEPAAIRVDPNALENAVLNLVVNARDAMPRGGKLVIAVSAADPADLPLTAAGDPTDTGAIAISVADTGKGMDPGTLAHIFEPFFTTKEQGRGTGLGLAMVYGFVHQNGGAIHVESSADQGTVVRLVFWRRPVDELEEPPARVPPTAAANSRAMVLVVEDEDDVRQHTVETLRELGYRVVEAHDASSALSLLARHCDDIDLMFCDYGLPNGTTGSELAAQAHLAHPSLKVLFTSGSAASETVAVDGEIAETIVCKPFTICELAEKVNEALSSADRPFDPQGHGI